MTLLSAVLGHRQRGGPRREHARAAGLRLRELRRADAGPRPAGARPADGQGPARASTRRSIAARTFTRVLPRDDAVARPRPACRASSPARCARHAVVGTAVVVRRRRHVIARIPLARPRRSRRVRLTRAARFITRPSTLLLLAVLLVAASPWPYVCVSARGGRGSGRWSRRDHHRHAQPGARQDARGAELHARPAAPHRRPDARCRAARASTSRARSSGSASR